MITVLPRQALASSASSERTMTAGETASPGWRRAIVLSGACVIGLLGVAAVPSVGFDHNPLNLRDPDSESVTTYRELLAERGRPPWAIVGLVNDTTSLSTLRVALEAREEVDRVASIEDFVPGQQAAKLERIDELSLMLGPGLTLRETEVSDESVVMAWRGVGRYARRHGKSLRSARRFDR